MSITAMHLLRKKKLHSKLLLFIIIPTALFTFLIDIEWFKLNFFNSNVQPALVYKHRKANVNFTCTEKIHTDVSRPLDRRVAEQLIVEHSHKFIYCEVPKVGCSNWKRVILLLNDSSGRTVNDLRHYAVHTSPFIRLSSYSLDQQKEILSNYTKVMFARDPMERVVSAYRDKFLHDDDVYYCKAFARRIKQKLGLKNNTKDKITFEQFVQYIVIEQNRDVHWRPIHQLCDPCKIQYDIIGKYKTISQDADFVLKTIRARESLKYPSMKHHSNDSRTNDEITRQYLETLPPDLFRKLLQVYSIDFIMFQYDQERFFQPETFWMK